MHAITHHYDIQATQLHEVGPIMILSILEIRKKRLRRITIFMLII